jgi:hypothetical protein
MEWSAGILLDKTQSRVIRVTPATDFGLGLGSEIVLM